MTQEGIYFERLADVHQRGLIRPHRNSAGFGQAAGAFASRMSPRDSRRRRPGPRLRNRSRAPGVARRSTVRTASDEVDGKEEDYGGE